MNWPTVRLDECTRIVGGSTPSTSRADYWDGNINWATPKDLSGLNSIYIAETPRKITQAGLASCSAEIIPVNSVLFSSRAPIGHVAINSKPMATNQGFKSFVPDRNQLSSGFLYWWLRSNRSYLESLGNGATFKEVSKAVVSRILIPLPPLNVQRRIAAILDQADVLRRKRREAVQHLRELPTIIFDQMVGRPARRRRCGRGS
jgi:type I restriction enzyme, S subunit